MEATCPELSTSSRTGPTTITITLWCGDPAGQVHTRAPPAVGPGMKDTVLVLPSTPLFFIILRSLYWPHCCLYSGVFSPLLPSALAHFSSRSFLSFFFFLKSLLNLLQYCFCFMFWFFGCKASGDWTPVPCIGRRSLNHWTTREIPSTSFYFGTWWLGKALIGPPSPIAAALSCSDSAVFRRETALQGDLMWLLACRWWQSCRRWKKLVKSPELSTVGLPWRRKVFPLRYPSESLSLFWAWN